MIKAMFAGKGVRKVNMKPQPFFFNSVREGYSDLLTKLKRLVKLKFLTIDIKKHYRLSGKTLHDFKPIQKKVFINL